jgi:hypothetical protein
MPFGSEEFKSKDDAGMPTINEYAIRMPWKYQLFNIAEMTRVFCISALFLNEKAIPVNELDGKEFVDLLQANAHSPLTKIRSWEESIELIVSLLQRPVVHPFFSIYSRVGMNLDGPIVVLSNRNEWSGIEWGYGSGPSLERVQTGALDEKMYPQSMSENKGAILTGPTLVPQLMAADLEVDHWMSELSRLMGYDACARIQHWCGNKSLAYDVEIIHFHIIIPGNLIDNTLTCNLYEMWKQGFARWFSVRDPFHGGNNVYPDVYDDIYSDETTSSATDATWVRPPWIGYDETKNLYGWPCEELTNWFQNQRLSYPPVGAEEVGMSHSYPEYNKYIFQHFITELS